MSLAFVSIVAILTTLLVLLLVNPFLTLQLVLLLRASIGPAREFSVNIGTFSVNGLAIVGLSMILVGLLSFLRNPSLSRSPFFMLYMLAIVWCGIAIPFVENQASAIRYLLQMLAPLMLLVLITNQANSREKIKSLLRIIAFSSVIPMIYGIYQSAMGLGVQKAGDMLRINSLFYLPNPYAFYLAVVGITLLICINSENRQWIRVLYLVLFTALIGNLILSGTRTALIGFIFGLIIYLFINRKFALIAFCALSSLIIVLSVPDMSERLVEPIEAFITDGGIDIDKGIDIKRPHWEWNTFQGRYFLWKMSWEFIERRPFLGYGLGSHATTIGHNVHNDYLRLLLETGIFGLIFYVAGFLVLLRQIYRSWRKAENTFDKYLQSGVFSVLCMLLIFMMADQVIVDNTMLWYVFTLIGLSMNSTRYRYKSD